MKAITGISLIICFLLNNINLSAQKIHRLGNLQNTYVYEGDFYKYKELGNIFINHDDAYSMYQSSLSAHKKANAFRNVTFAAMIIGTIAPLVDPSPMYCDLICITTGQSIGLISWLLVVPAMGITGLVWRIKSRKRLQKSMDIFNGNVDLGIQTSHPTWDVSMGSTASGIGLTISF